MKDRQDSNEQKTTESGATKTPAAGPVQGEGDYASARVYRKDIESFIDRNKERIPDMAKKAEDSLEGPEGAELERAEENGKSKARR